MEIHLLVREKRTRSLSYAFRFRKLTGEDSVEVARGVLTIVCVTHRPGGPMGAATLPPQIADAIQVATTELLNA